MKKIKYNIINVKNNLILASCPNLKLAKKYLKEMKKTDIFLKKYYGWKSLPKYKIVEIEEE